MVQLLQKALAQTHLLIAVQRSNNVVLFNQHAWRFASFLTCRSHRKIPMKSNT
jgi:hypothetical protein